MYGQSSPVLVLTYEPRGHFRASTISQLCDRLACRTPTHSPRFASSGGRVARVAVSQWQLTSNSLEAAGDAARDSRADAPANAHVRSVVSGLVLEHRVACKPAASTGVRP